jgi:cytochrome c553
VTRAGLFLVALASCQGWGIDPDLERMIDQPRIETYESSSAFADGRGTRLPPAGTVPREHLFIAPSADGYPMPLGRDVLLRGRRRFEIVCAACHGLLGDGASKVAENMSLKRPPSLHDDRLRALTPARLVEIMSKGYGLMPALVEQLRPEDRWAVAAYVKALQLSQHARLSELPPTLRAAAENALREEARP